MLFYMTRTIRSISKVLTPGSTASPANFKARDEIPASLIALSSRLVFKHNHNYASIAAKGKTSNLVNIPFPFYFKQFTLFFIIALLVVLSVRGIRASDLLLFQDDHLYAEQRVPLHLSHLPSTFGGLCSTW